MAKPPKGKPDQPALFPELDRLKAQEAKLRDEKIALLKTELAKARDVVRRLERELRLTGASLEDLGGWRINWDEVYGELGPTFTAKELRELTGANANLVASIIFRWKREVRIRPVGRGEYRKKA